MRSSDEPEWSSESVWMRFEGMSSGLSKVKVVCWSTCGRPEVIRFFLRGVSEGETGFSLVGLSTLVFLFELPRRRLVGVLGGSTWVAGDSGFSC